MQILDIKDTISEINSFYYYKLEPAEQGTNEYEGKSVKVLHTEIQK
jgi:hypothetical protein